MEYFDLFDKNKVKTGLTIPRDTEIPEGYYRLIVSLAIFNSNGDMLIQQRQTFKKGWSGLWDISCGGGQIAGESGEDAIHRETSEELGLDIDFSHMRPSLSIAIRSGFVDVYLIKKDVELSELTLQSSEVKDAKWASLDTILKMIDNGEFVPYNKGLINSLFFFKDSDSTTMK